MFRRRIVTTLLATAAVVAAAVSPLLPASAAAGATYPNPWPTTGDVAAHDPSMIQLASGQYVLYSTHNGLEARTSPDALHWTRNGSALPNGASWATAYTGDPKELWAPDVSYHNGRYWMYFAASSFGSNNSAIGLATSSSGLPGSWADQGVVYTSTSSSDYNAIDPNLAVDASGRWWLTFGSFWSDIKQIRLDPATGKVLAGAARTSVAFRPTAPQAEEAAFLYRHGSYYYLFVSWDFCCQGVNSTYRIMVGRSGSPNGPFTDASGVAMLNGGGTQLLATHGNTIGPGGQSVLPTSAGELLVYHYYDGANNGATHLGINTLGWTSAGWPVVR
jgi:arabinan endo-1,5-alpha-L-arabinosidase